MTFSIGADLFPLAAAILAAVTCGLLGNFLVLRKLSLMGDAISHSVLPGLVIAFLLTESRSTPTMLIGAVAAGIVTVLLVELVSRFGRVDSGASMGVVFSVMFALGVLLIERAAARQIELDPDCVLYGQLVTLAWHDAPETAAGLLSVDTLAAVPGPVVSLAVALLISALIVTLLFKELRLAAFDAGLASAQGFSAGWLHVVLMVLVAVATVAAFEAVGSILVIAMLVCPAATARLLTDRLPSQIAVSLVVAIASAVGGYFASSAVPGWFGRDAVNAAGSMTVFAGLLLALAALASPSHGALAKAFARRRVARQVLVDDLLAQLHRARERGHDRVAASELRALLAGRDVDLALAMGEKRGLVIFEAGEVRLTSPGRTEAARVVRSHRLWESYLVDEAGLAPDHVHNTAARLEHLRLAPKERTDTDPHGRPVPPAPDGRP